MNNFDIQFYKDLINERYATEISLGHSGASVRSFFKQKHPEFFDFLKHTYPGNFGNWAYMFVHDMHEIPKCHYCHEKDAKWYGFVRGFGKWCSMTCMNHDQEHQTAMHQTMLKKYGCEHALQISKFNKKFRTTIGNKKTDPKKWKQRDTRRKETCIKRYGVDNMMKVPETLKKIKTTLIEKYGVEHPAQNEKIKEKTKQTVSTRIIENPNYWKDRQKKTESTYLKKYGTAHPQKDIGLGIEQRKSTSVKRYGKEWYTQTHDCHMCRGKKVVIGSLSFDSLWEASVYEYCVQHNFDFEYQPDVSFEYECDGKNHIYHPDFKINEKLYEVKGDHFFRINESTGQEEMFLPFRGRNMTDEEYAVKCRDYNAKYQCMLRNGIVVLRGRELSDLNEVFKNEL